eukprot:Skav235339  [mRNA]  locus=scaffold520:847290:847760:+ [translate_table: standard]
MSNIGRWDCFALVKCPLAFPLLEAEESYKRLMEEILDTAQVTAEDGKPLCRTSGSGTGTCTAGDSSLEPRQCSPGFGALLGQDNLRMASWLVASVGNPSFRLLRSALGFVSHGGQARVPMARWFENGSATPIREKRRHLQATPGVFSEASGIRNHY